MPISNQKSQRQYIEEITAQAIQQALSTNPESLLFDPQGRVLIDVALTEETRKLFKDGFGESRIPQPITTVSLDVTQIPELNQAYKKCYQLNDAQSKQLAKVRGSIIPLQQEFNFHLALAARTYTKADKSRFPEDQMTFAHQEAMKRVQGLIQREFASALKKATKDEEINSVTFIKELDKARKKISAQAHTIFMEEVVKETGQILSTADLKKLNLKHAAEKTTATPNDLLHIDHSLDQVTWISGSENAAHERAKQQLGVHAIADRQILTIPLNKKDDENRKERLQIRTPSLDVKENISMRDAINDVSVKLLALSEKYSMRSLDDNILGRKAFTYNLHTAINHTLDDLRGANKQSWGARTILCGAHLYNKTQLSLQTPTEKKPFCFVQNLSVNGFGNSLGYGWNIGWNKLRNETTLMAEMAMLQNIMGPGDNKPQINKVFELYDDFLTDCPSYGENYFSRSAQGQEAINQIKAIKASWAAQEPAAQVTPVDKAKAALKKIMANNLHYQHDYAKLVQSLSIFIEEASIAGCKSGNERAQAINGRVAVLDHEAILNSNSIMNAMAALANAKPNNVKRLAAELNRNLTDEYDNHLQSALSLISVVDQGASAKLNATAPWYKFWTKINPNYAEESSLKHLSQSKAGKMQAHKGLTKEMISAWEGHPKGFGNFMGKLGIFLSVITIPIGPLVAAGIYQFSYKPYKEKLKEQTIDKLKSLDSNFQQRQLYKEYEAQKIISDSYKGLQKMHQVKNENDGSQLDKQLHGSQEKNHEKAAIKHTESPSTEGFFKQHREHFKTVLDELKRKEIDEPTKTTILKH